MTDQEMCEIFARNLNRLLSEKGMSKADLKRALGVGAATVSDWTHGRNIPRTPILSKMTVIFGCTLKELLQEEKDPAKDGEVGSKRQDLLNRVYRLSENDIDNALKLFSVMFPDK